MISIRSNPERIINGETIRIILDIEGKVNNSTYKNMFFNLTIKKNGGTHGNIILYPLKYIGNPLEWEINPYSYSGYDGTFNVSCSLQNSLNTICSCTFVVEPDLPNSKASSCNNITGILQNINLRKGINKKQEEKPIYLQSHQVQKQEKLINNQEINHKEKEIEKKKIANEINNSYLLTSVKVQRAFKNC